MPTPRNTKQKVYNAAKIISREGKEPTVADIRKYLEFTGSQTTLHKYLKEWKLKCFQSYGSNDNFIVENDPSKLLDENIQLRSNLEKLQAHNKNIEIECVKTERKNLELANSLGHTQEQLNVLHQHHQEIINEAKNMSELYQVLKEERAAMLSKIEADKDQLIASLREELKLSHRESLEQIKNISYDGHDQLMQEKVKTLNLQEQIKPLTEEIVKLQQELERANKITQPLKKEIEWLQRLMSEILTSEQLQEYEKKKQLAEFVRN